MKNDSPGHEVVQLFGTSKLNHHWLGKRNRTLWVFHQNERFFISCCFTKERPRNKTEGMFFFILFHCIIISQVNEESEDSYQTPDTSDPAPSQTQKKVILQGSCPPRTPPHPHPFCLCPPGRLLFVQDAFLWPLAKPGHTVNLGGPFVDGGARGGGGHKAIGCFPCCGKQQLQS